MLWCVNQSTELLMKLTDQFIIRTLRFLTASTLKNTFQAPVQELDTRFCGPATLNWLNAES